MSLATAVEETIAGKPGVFGVYARNLNTGETVGINADRVLPAESAAKTFILAYYSQLVASGAIDPTTRVTLDDEHRYIGPEFCDSLRPDSHPRSTISPG